MAVHKLFLMGIFDSMRAMTGTRVTTPTISRVAAYELGGVDIVIGSYRRNNIESVTV